MEILRMIAIGSIALLAVSVILFICLMHIKQNEKVNRLTTGLIPIIIFTGATTIIAMILSFLTLIPIVGISVAVAMAVILPVAWFIGGKSK